MDKKYVITNKQMRIGDRKFFQVRALRDIGDVKTGHFGGYVENEHNLSQEGNCWIEPMVVLMDNARVENDAQVTGDSVIRDNAIVKDNALVSDAVICDNVIVKDDAFIIGGKYEFQDITIKENISIRGYLRGIITIGGDTVFEGQDGLDIETDISIGFNNTDEN